MNIADTHFADVVRELNTRASLGGDLQSVFHDVSDDFYALLCLGDYAGYNALKALLPDWPAPEVIAEFRFSPSVLDSVRESLAFWRLVKETYAEHGRKPLSETRMVDFGAGWGRITRFFAKDVPARQLYAIEPNAHFRSIFKAHRVPGILVESDWNSDLTLPVNHIDLLVSFSILTHTSDQLTRNVAARWAEIVRPGGVVVATIRPGPFIGTDSPEMAKFTAAEIADAHDRYARGELAYKYYEVNVPQWGVTIMPLSYVYEVFSPYFRLIGPRFMLQNPAQLPIVMVRE